MQQHKGIFDGVYLAYFSAEYGTSIGIFLVSNGRISGGDQGGGIYDGEFNVMDKTANGEIIFTTTKSTMTITGTQNDLPVSFVTKYSFVLPLEKQDFHRLDTIGGVINIRFEKIRDIENDG